MHRPYLPARDKPFLVTSYSGLVHQPYGKPQISWEVTEEFNGGLDLDMFNNRLNISLDLIPRQLVYMLLEQNLPRTSGFGKVTRSIGSGMYPWHLKSV